MAHFAKIEDNVVTEVIVVGNGDCGDLDFPESEPIGQEFIASVGLEGEWRQTSYNHKFRRRYAGIGYTFDRMRDAFIQPQPYPSWSLNEETLEWDPPYPMPTDGESYSWDEINKVWEQVSDYAAAGELTPPDSE